MSYCLDPEAVIEINRGHVALTGEPFAIRDRPGLLGALARPLSGFAAVGLFPTPVAKAGAVLHRMAQSHPFIQGNKRTAWTSATTFLGLHGFGIEASDTEATVFVLAVVEGAYDADGAALWLADRLTL